MHRRTLPDHAKAIAMFLVVYGHSLATDWGIGRWIYSFHVPMFFLVSGYLLDRGRLRDGFFAQLLALLERHAQPIPLSLQFQHLAAAL